MLEINTRYSCDWLESEAYLIITNICSRLISYDYFINNTEFYCHGSCSPKEFQSKIDQKLLVKEKEEEKEMSKIDNRKIKVGQRYFNDQGETIQKDGSAKLIDPFEIKPEHYMPTSMTKKKEEPKKEVDFSHLGKFLQIAFGEGIKKQAELDGPEEYVVKNKCDHEWVDTGMRWTFCKKCNADNNE